MLERTPTGDDKLRVTHAQATSRSGATPATRYFADDDDEPAVIVPSALRSAATIARKRPAERLPSECDNPSSAPRRSNRGQSRRTSVPQAVTALIGDGSIGCRLPLTPTPIATLDEPLTATQEAFVADHIVLPSPPPAFRLRSASPASATGAHEPAPRFATGTRARETPRLDKTTWEQTTRSFFQFIDSRPLAVADS